MTIYSYGDVLLLPFPFTNQSTIKQRPAVVISSDHYNQRKADIIVMAITSQIKQRLELGDMLIIDWNGAGLVKPSIIKSVVATLEKSLIIKKLGSLQKQDKNNLDSLLLDLIGCHSLELDS